MPAANWLHLSKVEFATTDHEPRRRTSLDKRYYGFEGYARGLCACPLILVIGLTEQLCRNLIARNWELFYLIGTGVLKAVRPASVMR
jgi:hypothetical protein